MDKILVFGHKSPDTDSICSALVKTILDKKKNGVEHIPARLGNINKETQYVLDYLGLEAPIFIENIEEGQKVILVDHNEFCQSASGIEKAKIIGVIDHHNMFKDSNIEIEKTEAVLMASAIISDTLLLKSPTTTKKDVEALKDLAIIANIDINIYGLDMLKAGTDLSNFTAEELLEIDAKCIDMKGNKVKIAQVNTVDIEDVLKSQADIEAAINKKIEEENLDLFMFAITDIVNSNSEALVLGKRSDIVEKAYNVKLENNRAFLPGVVSRKKQILPIMQENA